MTKQIGIVGFHRNDMFGVHSDYLHFVERFGTPVIIPPLLSKSDFIGKFGHIEGLVLPGGADINPSRYAHNGLHYEILKRWYCDPYDAEQEHFDTVILPSVLAAEIPVFGICRGLQTLNVFLGGTLRNVDWHPKSKGKKDFVHSIEFAYNGPTQKVNSFHHQAVAKLANSLEAIAYSDDGIVEIVRHRFFPVAAVQYHPERFEDNWSISTCEYLFS